MTGASVLQQAEPLGQETEANHHVASLIVRLRHGVIPLELTVAVYLDRTAIIIAGPSHNGYHVSPSRPVSDSDPFQCSSSALDVW